MTMTPKQLRDVAWALDNISRFALKLLQPYVALEPMNAATGEITVVLTRGEDPMPQEDAKKLVEWIKSDDMQRDLRAFADELDRSDASAAKEGREDG